jgi:hypothetical protein
MRNLYYVNLYLTCYKFVSYFKRILRASIHRGIRVLGVPIFPCERREQYEKPYEIGD